MTAPTLLVVAKSPVPGRAKTRLAATVGDAGAAELAAAALLDTLDAAADSGLPLVVALTGELNAAARGAEIAERMAAIRVIGQRGDGFAARLVNAHHDADDGFGVVQVGMDTPQLTGSDLRAAADSLQIRRSALGMATDGGWWILAERDSRDVRLLANVPMSTSQTGERTKRALADAGVDVADLPVMTDVDEWADARSVAQAAPHTRFAAAVRHTVLPPTPSRHTAERHTAERHTAERHTAERHTTLREARAGSAAGGPA